MAAIAAAIIGRAGPAAITNIPVASKETDTKPVCTSDQNTEHSEQREQLLGLFWPLTFAQPHTGTAAILVDEFDAGCRANPIGFVLQNEAAGPNEHQQSLRRLGFAALQGVLKCHANKALIGNFLFFSPTAHGV